jgi:activator of HSP90 ATPase
MKLDSLNAEATTWALCSRRSFAVQLTAVSSALVLAGRALGAGAGSGSEGGAGAAGSDGLSHISEAIHQEVLFNANRRRVYEALTDAQRFDRVSGLSAAMKSASMAGAAPTEISREVGGAFSLFGGYVTGRHVELLPGERIVQVWRAGSWKPGDYSIVRFALSDEGSGTKLVCDHRGFPDGTGTHLAEGWHLNYWAPLEKYLSSVGA